MNEPGAKPALGVPTIRTLSPGLPVQQPPNELWLLISRHEAQWLTNLLRPLVSSAGVYEAITATAHRTGMERNWPRNKRARTGTRKKANLVRGVKWFLPPPVLSSAPPAPNARVMARKRASKFQAFISRVTSGAHQNRICFARQIKTPFGCFARCLRYAMGVANSALALPLGAERSIQSARPALSLTRTS